MFYSQLTKREREVIQYVCKGYTNKEIGKIIFISKSTVKNIWSLFLRN